MAINTRDRRASCIAYSLPFGRVWPSADGGVDSLEDRVHADYLYASGLTLEEAVSYIYLSGVYSPTISKSGRYSPGIPMSGIYSPTISKRGRA